MRDDFNDDLPGIRVTTEDRFGALPNNAREPEPPVVRAVREPVVQRQRNGALWAVCLSLLIALVGLGYWSHEQQSRLQRQLIATQESFARISEEAAGQLQDISGKVIATESSLGESEQARLQQLRQLEQRVEQLSATQQTQQQLLAEQQQQSQTGQQRLQQLQQASEARAQQLAELEERAATLGETQQSQGQALAQLDEQTDAAGEAQAVLRQELTQIGQQLQALAKLEQQVAEQGTLMARQRGELQALMEASSGRSVEQEMLVLRSELDLRLASFEEALQAIDSFRVQANRNISTLQSQLGNLQQQLGQR